MNANDQRIYTENANRHGEVSYQGKTFALLAQAEPTNRVFPGWWGDAREGEEYIQEWSAPAIGQDGEEYVTIWQCDAVKGQDRRTTPTGRGTTYIVLKPSELPAPETGQN